SQHLGDWRTGHRSIDGNSGQARRLPRRLVHHKGRNSLMSPSPRTLFEKLWDTHTVREPAGEPALLYIDLHLVHEVTSPQAFEGLRVANRRVRRPDLTVATIDHNVPTTDRRLPITDPISAKQIETL